MQKPSCYCGVALSPHSSSFLLLRTTIVPRAYLPQQDWRGYLDASWKYAGPKWTPRALSGRISEGLVVDLPAGRLQAAKASRPSCFAKPSGGTNGAAPPLPSLRLLVDQVMDMLMSATDGMDFSSIAASAAAADGNTVMTAVCSIGIALGLAHYLQGDGRQGNKAAAGGATAVAEKKPDGRGQSKSPPRKAAASVDTSFVDLSKSIARIKPQLLVLDEAQLLALRAREASGAARKGMLSSIDQRLRALPR